MMRLKLKLCNIILTKQKCGLKTQRDKFVNYVVVANYFLAWIWVIVRGVGIDTVFVTVWSRQRPVL